jgi:uncharacterized membrane protein
MIPLWGYLVGAVFWALVLLRRAKHRRQAQIVNVTEGRHRPIRGGRF